MKIYISLGMIAIGCLSILGTYLGASRKRNYFRGYWKWSFIGNFLFELGGQKALIYCEYFCGALAILLGIGYLILV